MCYIKFQNGNESAAGLCAAVKDPSCRVLISRSDGPTHLSAAERKFHTSSTERSPVATPLSDFNTRLCLLTEEMLACISEVNVPVSLCV